MSTEQFDFELFKKMLDLPVDAYSQHYVLRSEIDEAVDRLGTHLER